MHDTWLAFLKQQGASIQDNGTIDFDNTHINLNETPLVSPLSGFAILAVSGDDRHSFLHGQFINDLNLIEKPSAQLSAWCNAKGQVITDLLIINTGISYLLIFKEDQKEFVQKRLGMFVLRAKVTIEDISNISPLIGIANKKDLSALTPNTPANPGDVTAHEGLVIIKHPDNSGRYIIMASNEILINKVSELRDSFTLVSSSIWNLLDILAGLAWTCTATQEQFLPQMLNMDLLKGLSYQKGCYPGQEVIARLHYRGEVKKRVQLIRAGFVLNIGDVIHLQDANDKVGMIINTEKHPDGSLYALAVIELDKLDETHFINKQTISIERLPYDIES